MSVQLAARPSAPDSATPSVDFDLDAVDSALDRGDLESVRCLLGVNQEVWRLLLSSL